MKFAIIAAGEGSRLSDEGVPMPKPLVPLLGEPMIKRLVRIFRSHGAEEIVIVVNDLVPQTREFVCEMQQNTAEDEAPIRLVVKTTPSSMHSFAAITPYLDGSPFCLTTVDTVFREEDFAAYINEFKSSELDGLMAVTDFIDDEKPLYVETTSDLSITAFFDTPTNDSRFISGGIYCLKPRAIDILYDCMDKGISRMRNYQRALVSEGLRLTAYPFSKILDVDHADDIAKAEAFLNEKR